MNHKLRQAISHTILILLGAVALVPAPVAAGPWQRGALEAEHQPFPFDSDEEILEYLRTAEIRSATKLSTGVTRPKKLRLERDGLAAHAVFHDVSVQELGPRELPNGHRVMFLNDSYRNQVAAYELSRLLGMDSVPPTVLRKSGRTPGSAQLWIEDAMTEKDRRDRSLDPPNPLRWTYQRWDRLVFDNLINNLDRNQGNMLIDADWKLWLIDHTRSFGADRALPYEEQLYRVSRTLWSRLKTLDERLLKDRLRPYLDPSGIKALLRRQELIVQIFEEKIARLGENVVLFNRG